MPISTYILPLVTILTLTLSVSALVRELNIANALIAPDGFRRSASVTEGVFPMPIITGTKGDNFQINVINQLNDSSMAKSTSIHWHGIFQEHTNWADGPAFVNQCPIATNHSFLYNFNVSDQAGTFWYHSHLGVQYCDGLRGPMVIYDPEDPLQDLYDIDDETTVITLSDWYHLATPVLPRPAVADSVLINGLGRYAGGPASPLSITNVQQGKRYRMRLVSMSCEPNYIFSIDGHNLTVIEADGIETEPLVVDSIQIYSAQRYSFILNANQPINNYWMRVIPDIGPLGFDNGINSAILRYAGAPDANPISVQSPSVLPLIESNLHVLNPVPVPGGPSPGDVDVAYNLLLNFTGTGFTINNTPFQGPNVPILLQILSGAQTADQLMPSGSVYPLPRDSSIEISIPGGVIGGPHPFHLHGAAFHVVRSAGSSTYNYDNPVMRDTVSIGDDVGDNVTFRFQTTNSGPWFLHCHIEFHLEMGLGIVFAEDQPDVVVDNPVPDAWTQLCPIYNTLDPFQLGFVGR